MIDFHTHALLQKIIRRESRSLLQFVGESFPWTSPGERAALAKLQEMIEAERQGTAALGRLLNRQRLPLPTLGAYPQSFTNINYVSLDFLLPLLIDNLRRSIGDLEHDLASLYDTEARAEVRNILDMKRKHLQELEKMTATYQPAGV